MVGGEYKSKKKGGEKGENELSKRPSKSEKEWSAMEMEMETEMEMDESFGWCSGQILGIGGGGGGRTGL